MITAIRKIIRKFLGKYYKFEKKVDLFFLILLLTSTSYSIIFLKNNNQNFFLANIFYVFGFFVIIIKLYSKSVSNQRLQILDLICTLNYHEKLKGAEIGVLFGDYSKTILERINHNNCIIEKLYLIDEWKVSNDYTHGESGGGLLNKAKLKVYSEFKYNKKIEILEKSSLKAAKLIKNNSLNFVYIDANHKYNFVKKDLNIWWPKLKKHGILFGDDYFSKSKEKYGVIKAVNEFVFKKKTIVHHTDNFKQYFFIKN